MPRSPYTGLSTWPLKCNNFSPNNMKINVHNTSLFTELSHFISRWTYFVSRLIGGYNMVTSLHRSRYLAVEQSIRLRCLPIVNISCLLWCWIVNNVDKQWSYWLIRECCRFRLIEAWVDGRLKITVCVIFEWDWTFNE